MNFGVNSVLLRLDLAMITYWVSDNESTVSNVQNLGSNTTEK